MNVFPMNALHNVANLKNLYPISSQSKENVTHMSSCLAYNMEVPIDSIVR